MWSCHLFSFTKNKEKKQKKQTYTIEFPQILLI